MKKSQAALEFLSSYGWTILVVLVILGAMVNMGVFDSNSIQQESCVGPVSMYCFQKPSLTGNHISIAIKNENGFSISLHDSDHVNPLYITSDDCVIQSSEITCQSGNTAGVLDSCTAENDETAVIDITCTNALPAGNLKAIINLKYDNLESGLSHDAEYQIIGKV